ncbi:MAG: DUF4446 family protein [Actinobacteria bacterium]|nr:DUF4446 family protein [Actinomycetota bacterium]
MSLAIGVMGLGLGIFAAIRLSWLRRTYSLLQSTDAGETFVEVVARTREEFEALSEHVRRLDRGLLETRGEVTQALRHVSVVRYDAFGDLAGRFSYSAAVLDDSGDGLIFTSIHGRTETRTYLKGLHAGKPDITLSPEELEAIALARGGNG